MSTLRSCDHTIRIYNNVTVEVYVNFQSCKNYEVQFIDNCTLVERVRILTCTDPEMMQIFYRFYGCKVKVLCIQKCIYLTVDQKVTHRLCKTTHTKTHTDISFFHYLCK